MPTVSENEHWGENYDWSRRGEEWSKVWGSPAMQWHGTLMPRLYPFLPAKAIVEIGCGCGRWTDFLKDHCQRLIAIDLSQKCVDACGERFRDVPHVTCHRNDGVSLSLIEDGWADLVFSFDALPMADAPTMSGYLHQLPRILAPRGVAFLHHSNFGAYPLYQRIAGVPGLERVLRGIGLMERELYWRDGCVSARLVADAARALGLSCRQEIIRWGTRRLRMDAISLVGHGFPDGPPTHLDTSFDEEAGRLSLLSRLYST